MYMGQGVSGPAHCREAAACEGEVRAEEGIGCELMVKGQSARQISDALCSDVSTLICLDLDRNLNGRFSIGRTVTEYAAECVLCHVKAFDLFHCVLTKVALPLASSKLFRPVLCA